MFYSSVENHDVSPVSMVDKRFITLLYEQKEKKQNAYPVQYLENIWPAIEQLLILVIVALSC